MRAKGLVAIACAAVIALGGCGDGDEPQENPTPAGAPRSFFGMVPQSRLTGEDYARMQQGGVGSLRIFLPWGLIDPTVYPGDYEFDEYDRTILEAARHDLDVLPFIYGSPNWVAQQIDRVECGEEVGCDTYAPRSEAALQYWAGFVGDVVDRYGPRGTLWAEHPDVVAHPIRAWQIWNEQNSPTFYLPQPDVASYAQLLDAAAEQIRRRDPGAQVVIGGMFGTPLGGQSPAISAPDFLRQLYAIEGSDGSFDGIAAHPYAAHVEKAESQIELMHDEIVAAGDDDASLWITELGWASSGPDVPLVKDPQGQAGLLTESYDYFLDRRVEWNIQGVYWYAWRDTDVPICDWCPGSGLFPQDSLEQPKPAWEAFTAFTGGS